MNLVDNVITESILINQTENWLHGHCDHLM